MGYIATSTHSTLETFHTRTGTFIMFSETTRTNANWLVMATEFPYKITGTSPRYSACTHPPVSHLLRRTPKVRLNAPGYNRRLFVLPNSVACGGGVVMSPNLD